jgi:hypothetical protein
MVHVHVHGAYPCSCCMPISMFHACVNAEWPYKCCMPMFMLHAHAHAAFPCPCCMSMPIQHARAHFACPRSQCMPISMLHVNAACPQTVPLLTTKIAASCKEDINRATQNSCLTDNQDHEGDGHPLEGHRGQGLQAIRVLD